ncbi:MAG: PQQ-binding-like beta-propeller repeat protein [Deltaproteobacteria bacterium]
MTQIRADNQSGTKQLIRAYPRHPRFFVFVVMAAAVWLGTAAPALAQRDPAPAAAPAVFLDTDPVAAKMLGAARDFLAARQWGDAVDLLRQITDQHGDRLVAIEPGRYVNVQTFADILVASMPAEGLKQYRAKTDPQARRWFETARRLHDEEGLEKVVRKAFLSSYGDDALLLLGELAWEKGALARARGYWEKLIPPATRPEAGELPMQLKFPDSEIDPALIKSRLVLCSLMQGNTSRAQAEYEAFRETYPQAAATFAGRHGNLAETLKALVAAAGEERRAPPAGPEAATFASNPGRNQVFPRAVDVGGVLWSLPLKEMRVERLARGEEGFDRFDRSDRGPAALPIDVPSYYPVAWKNIVFYCDEAEVFACELAGDKRGKAPWGNEAWIYRLPAELQQHAPAQRQRAGLPRFTLSIDRGKLYARLGAIAAPGRNRGFRPSPSVLVCLDLARQGDLAWMIKAEELDAEAGKWVFDGAPVADGGKVYVALHRNDPQLQLNVACFDAASARLLWNRKVCGGVEPIAGDLDEVRHQLLTLAEERLYYCTNLGAVAALDARDGTTRWVTTYSRVESENVAAFNKRQLLGPNPCLFHDGVVFAAPTDGDRILAYDAETGILKWDQELNGKVQQLIGVSGTRLIAAGEMLWALDAETGRVVWRDGRTAPEAATWGRGVLAGGLVYWPRREEIRIVDIATGQARRQIDLAEQHGLTGGGNLTIAGDMLLCAQSDRLVAFSQFGVLKKPPRNELVLQRKRGAGF